MDVSVRSGSARQCTGRRSAPRSSRLCCDSADRYMSQAPDAPLPLGTVPKRFGQGPEAGRNRGAIRRAIMSGPPRNSVTADCSARTRQREEKIRPSESTESCTGGDLGRFRGEPRAENRLQQEYGFVGARGEVALVSPSFISSRGLKEGRQVSHDYDPALCRPHSVSGKRPEALLAKLGPLCLRRVREVLGVPPGQAPAHPKQVPPVEAQGEAVTPRVLAVDRHGRLSRWCRSPPTPSRAPSWPRRGAASRLRGSGAGRAGTAAPRRETLCKQHSGTSTPPTSATRCDRPCNMCGPFPRATGIPWQSGP